MADRPTISYERDARAWARLITGTESFEGVRGRVMRCPDCGGHRLDLGGPHAARVTPKGLVDCTGKAVPNG